MNKSQIFTQAHRITKKVRKNNPSANYSATFSAALTSLYEGIEAKKASIKEEANWKTLKFPHIFKSAQDILNKEISNVFFVRNVADSIIKNIESVKASNRRHAMEAAKFYQNKGVTMC